MDWNWSEPAASPRMRAPDDGIVSSQRRLGWVAQRWSTILDEIPDAESSRLTRGRTYARGGRVRDLWVSPGLASAQVIGSKPHDVSIRVHSFEDARWDAVVRTLLEDLWLIAAMLEGKLPRELVERLESRGVALVPRWDELGVNCNCQDFAIPCAHITAVHNVMSDVLDGDPFLLLTLRGRTREQLLAALRLAWKDPEPLVTFESSVEEEPPDGDWFRSPTPLPPMSFDPREAEVAAAGMRAMGPPPGEGELERALGPLYEAGSNAAIQLAHLEPDPTDLPPCGPDMIAPEPEDLPAPDALLEESDDAQEITELLVDLLAELESAKSKELSDRLGLPMALVRAELVELEQLGIVYRTGQTRGTRWWLG